MQVIVNAASRQKNCLSATNDGYTHHIERRIPGWRIRRTRRRCGKHEIRDANQRAGRQTHLSRTESHHSSLMLHADVRMLLRLDAVHCMVSTHPHNRSPGFGNRGTWRGTIVR